MFNVVDEVLPVNQIERVFRDFYSGSLGEADLEERLLRDVDEERFRSICQTALDGLSVRELNLWMLVERRARARERRVPYTASRTPAGLAAPVPGSAGSCPSASPASSPTVPNTQHSACGLRAACRIHSTPGRTPADLKQHELEQEWKLPPLAERYKRISTNRDIAETCNAEWVTPGHPLFEALHRHSLELAQTPLGTGACFHSITHGTPARLDLYRARHRNRGAATVKQRPWSSRPAAADDLNAPLNATVLDRVHAAMLL